jgi:hypothetical protein
MAITYEYRSPDFDSELSRVADTDNATSQTITLKIFTEMVDLQRGVAKKGWKATHLSPPIEALVTPFKTAATADRTLA